MDGKDQPGTHRATILIVEDELLVRWAMADHLQECGFKTLTASNAEEAIEAVQKYDPKIDLVFSDVRMIGAMDGFALAAWIRQHRPDVAVILTSGHAQARDAAQELCEQVGEIVRKPYSYDAVVARIEQALSSRAT
jgi:DNA-binding NtrC family response regulator